MDREGIKIKNATKWSVASEVLAKLVSPVTNMVLARVLTPEAFGIVAIIMMIISFVDLFASAGFQKYLVQHDFKNEEDLVESANVAFITNMCFSIIFWLIIAGLSGRIANIMGNSGYTTAIVVAGSLLPMTSFSSIQMSLFTRNYQFKTLFRVRMIGILVPVFISIPLALMGMEYWALLIGTMSKQLINAIVLSINCVWKPKMTYSFKVLRRMLSFSLWSMTELIGQWLKENLPVIVVGSILSTYYLGLYKTAMVTVNSICALIYSSIAPVAFVAMSRAQNDREAFQQKFYAFMQLISIGLMPVGVGVFIFRNLVTQIMLGSQWLEISDFLGMFGLATALYSIIGPLSFEAYRARGNPKIAVFVYIIQNFILLPILFFVARVGFEALTVTTSILTFIPIVFHVVLIKSVLGISLARIVRNLLAPIIASSIMGGTAYYLSKIQMSTVSGLLSIGLCAIVYCLVMMVFPDMRNKIRTIRE